MRVEAEYETAMLAHAPMEPPVAVAWVHDGRCDIQAPVQDPQDVRRRVAEWLGIEPERVKVAVTLLGGAFGRKSQIDFVFEAVEVSRRAGVPVKLFWTREDDIRNCYFHAESVHRMGARPGEDGLAGAVRIRSALPPLQREAGKDTDPTTHGESGGGGGRVGFVGEGEEEVGPAGVDAEVGVAGVEDETDFVFEAVQHGEEHVVELGEEAAVGTEMEDEGALEGIVEFAVEGEVHG